MSNNWKVFVAIVLGIGAVVGAGLVLYAGELG